MKGDFRGHFPQLWKKYPDGESTREFLAGKIICVEIKRQLPYHNS